ncbi:MAG: hypothetical protein DME23_04160 [Verrucomicrobia bacterium]|nr:MAG: hypothetical protein DME23_04160 [Verrucomicrobiota bacterium]
MNQSANQNEVETLTQGYLEGSLTPSESPRLLALLKEDPARVKLILANLQTDALIKEVVDQSDWVVRTSTAAALSADEILPAILIEEIDFSALSASVETLAQPNLPAPQRWRVPSRRTWLLMAACIAILLSIAFLLLSPLESTPRVASVADAQTTVERAGQTLAASKGMRFASGDVLKTDTNGTAAINFGREQTQIELAANTELKILDWKKSKRFELQAGEIKATVARQRWFRAMVVITPQAKVTVLGTEFVLSATTNLTRLEVRKGQVRLMRQSDGKAVQVAAGSYAIAAAGSELAALPITGKVLREVWRHVQGSEVHDLRLQPGFPDRPDELGFLAALETLKETNDTFGVRLRGYLIPDETDDYTFIVSANGAVALWLSEDESPENRVRIAQASAGAQSSEATVRASFNATQRQSAPVRLERGRRYYFEVLYVHGAGQGDPALKVAWTRPGHEAEEIPSECLAPFITERGAKR